MVDDLWIVCLPHERDRIQLSFPQAHILTPGTAVCARGFSNIAVTGDAKEFFDAYPEGTKTKEWLGHICSRYVPPEIARA